MKVLEKRLSDLNAQKETLDISYCSPLPSTLTLLYLQVKALEKRLSELNAQKKTHEQVGGPEPLEQPLSPVRGAVVNGQVVHYPGLS